MRLSLESPRENPFARRRSKKLTLREIRRKNIGLNIKFNLGLCRNKSVAFGLGPLTTSASSMLTGVTSIVRVINDNIKTDKS